MNIYKFTILLNFAKNVHQQCQIVKRALHQQRVLFVLAQNILSLMKLVVLINVIQMRYQLIINVLNAQII